MALDYDERVRQCKMSIKAHEVFQMQALREKRLRYFNLFLETGALTVSAFVGFRCYQTSVLEASILRSLTGNPYILRVSSPGTFLMFFIFMTTAVFTAWDFQGVVLAKQMLASQEYAIAELKKELSSLKSNAPEENNVPIE